jgi:hypothetical protein
MGAAAELGKSGLSGTAAAVGVVPENASALVIENVLASCTGDVTGWG